MASFLFFSACSFSFFRLLFLTTDGSSEAASAAGLDQRCHGDQLSIARIRLILD